MTINEIEQMVGNNTVFEYKNYKLILKGGY